MDDYRKYFDPQTLAKLAGLDLKARLIVEGYLTGLHKSPYSGFSVEFAEHREYAPGDEMRYVDWKVFGKTDRFYVKRFEEETNFACHILVDASESMGYRSARASLSKIEYAKLIAAALAHLVVRQQDAVGLVAFNTEITKFLSPSSQPSRLKELAHILEELSPRGETSLGPIFHDLAERIRKRGLVIILSDLFDEVETLLSGLKHLRHRRHDVSVMQVIDPAEQDFPFEDPTRFRGLEGLPEQSVDPRSLRRSYQREFEGFLHELQAMCGDLHMDYTLLRTDQPVDVALRSFLTRRMHCAGRT